MERMLSYRREFSELPGLQEAKTLCYTLSAKVDQGGLCFGVRVTEINGAYALSDEIPPFTNKLTQAEQLLTYLYENAVSVEQCVSVIADVCAAMDPAEWKGDDGAIANQAAHSGRQPGNLRYLGEFFCPGTAC